MRIIYINLKYVECVGVFFAYYLDTVQRSPDASVIKTFKDFCSH